MFLTAKGKLEEVQGSGYQITEIIVKPKVVLASAGDLSMMRESWESQRQLLYLQLDQSANQDRARSLQYFFYGSGLLRRSLLGLLDTALGHTEQELIKGILSRYASQDLYYHALRTRQAGVRSFISFHVLVPGEWSVQRGHDLVERVERDIRAAVPGATVFTHLEPINDPAAWQDLTLDRRDAVIRSKGY